MERQNSKAGQPIQKELNAEISQPSASVYFQLLKKIATLGDPQTTQAQVSDSCSCQAQAGEPWTPDGKCLHSWVREPGTATQVKVQEGGW